jgi:hypothetical protein
MYNQFITTAEFESDLMLLSDTFVWHLLHPLTLRMFLTRYQNDGTQLGHMLQL